MKKEKEEDNVALILLFKTKLKTYYFHMAFIDVPDID